MLSFLSLSGLLLIPSIVNSDSDSSSHLFLPPQVVVYDKALVPHCSGPALHVRWSEAGSPPGGKMSLSPRKSVEQRIVGIRSTFCGLTFARLVEIQLKN